MHNVVFLVTACKKSGPIQQMLNIISHLDRNVFKPFLITIYPESNDGTSQLQKYLSAGVVHHYVPLSKKDIILGKTRSLKDKLDEIHPIAIHSLGVFPDLAISKMRYKGHIITMRNYIFEDYCAKFGTLKGLILAYIHLFAVKRADKVFSCSKSLSVKYKEKLKLDFPYIQNGVELGKYYPVDSEKKEFLRNQFNLPLSKRIYVYSGQFISRKDQRFLLDVFEKMDNDNNCLLLLLGNGPDFAELKSRYNNQEKYMFAGSVDNVAEYLQASDVYISSSKSEGLPNGVLEAMGCGLPVLLSDIIQHKEVIEGNKSVGLLYALGNESDCLDKIKLMNKKILSCSNRESFEYVNVFFSAKKNSEAYQKEYLKFNS